MDSAFYSPTPPLAVPAILRHPRRLSEESGRWTPSPLSDKQRMGTHRTSLLGPSDSALPSFHGRLSALTFRRLSDGAHPPPACSASCPFLPPLDRSAGGAAAASMLDVRQLQRRAAAVSAASPQRGAAAREVNVVFRPPDRARRLQLRARLSHGGELQWRRPIPPIAAPPQAAVAAGVGCREAEPAGRDDADRTREASLATCVYTSPLPKGKSQTVAVAGGLELADDGCQLTVSPDVADTPGDSVASAEESTEDLFAKTMPHRRLDLRAFMQPSV
ncbi:hypothetical protein STCU_10774 [Strigomonas culicis]|uniref:Uncharacterized protein n=1 Tax=Strigomonas culicis TaxID=28005 RepID=S9TK29_9TRYP|nr:hypothetical protein STCU_10774 [Strigomonas culicis]|eukprot:EPY17179.1 hypothetical protein STCU_10774 [Strigomonas culicis]